MLKLGTLKCPEDKSNLWFEIFQGMRIRHEAEGEHHYNAKCPTCHKYYTVKAPAEQKGQHERPD